MTKTEIKAALDLAGISYAKKANLATLVAAYNANCVGEGEPLLNEDGTLAVTPEMQQASDESTALVEAGAAKEKGDDTPTPDAPTPDPVAPPVADATPTAAGLKIEKDRPEQNGVKRPSVGGKCRAIWDALDDYRAETGELPTSKTVKELAADSGWNPNNASIEYYQWRKFNGIAKGA